MTDINLTWPQVLAWRLAQQHLDQPAPHDQMLAVVSRICGLQAQVMSAAGLALSARVAEVTPTDVAAALWTQRTLVKLWAMRGTLHLVPAADIPLHVAATRATRTRRYPAGWLDYYGVTAEDVAAILEIARTILTDQPMTRTQFSDLVVAHTGAAGLREAILNGWGSALKPSSFHGYLCFGPSQGQNVTFVQPRRWLDDWQDVDEEYAVAAVVRRFLHAYGPITMNEFALWWGVGTTVANKMFRQVGDEVTEVAVEGMKGWVLAADVPQIEQATTATNVRLLPNFDPYILAANRGCTAIVPEAHKARVYRIAGWISPVLLVNGAVAGVWQYTQRGGNIEVRVEPFRPLSAEVAALIEAEVERLSRYWASPTQLTFGQADKVPIQ